MPGMDGFGVVEEIQRNSQIIGSTVTVMMLTSAGAAGDARAAGTSGSAPT